MIASRKKLCLIYLGPLFCFIGIIYTVFYTEYKLPRMVKQMQNNLAINKNWYSTNTESEGIRMFSIFPDNKSNDAKEAKENENDTENNLENESSHSLEECQIWIPIKGVSLIKNINNNITDVTFFQVCSIESAIKSSRSDEEMRNKICILIDRHDVSLSNELNVNDTLSLTPNAGVQSFHKIREAKWFQALKKKYNKEENQLSLIIPDYATVFSGTIFEETYINSADLSFLSPAFIWSLLWKHGGLHLYPGTVLFPSFRSYYNFVALNPKKSEVRLNILQFVDRHHELVAKSLHHMMEQSLKHKAVQERKEDENLLRLDFVGVNMNEINGGLNDMTNMEWTNEVTRFCNRTTKKLQLNQMCQDVEIVGDKSVPKISTDNFIEMMTASIKKPKAKRRNKKNRKIKGEVIEKDVLAIELSPSNDENQFLLSEILKEKEKSKSLRASLQKMCPISFSWYLNELKLS